jgi:uncharacterized protein (TIGR03032 family)
MANAAEQLETRDIHCTHCDNFPALLTQLRTSVLISTYQTGHLVVVAARQGRLVLTFHQFERAMGVAVNASSIAVCTRKEVWFAPTAPDIAAKLEPRGLFDACYLARVSHFTDDIRAHEASWVGKEFWVVNTLFSCLSALHPYYSFAPRWKPLFISALVPEDRCHLNGLATEDGQARYVSALGETDSAAGWRPGKPTGGCLIEVPSGQIVARGLSLPHSPRVAGNKLYFLHSGRGRLEVVDRSTGKVESVADLPGVARGLAIFGEYAFVGLSKARPSLSDVPIVEQRELLKCGVVVVNLRTGNHVANLEFQNGVEEIFDVQVLPGVTYPHVSGPWAERDTGQPLWTIPPQAAGTTPPG